MSRMGNFEARLERAGDLDFTVKPAGLFVVTPTGAQDLSTKDEALVADLRDFGLIVTGLARSDARLIVATRNACGLPLVAVVNRSEGEHDEAFARLATKATVR